MGILDTVTNAVSAVAETVAGVFSGDDKKETATGTIRIQYYRSVISTPKTHKQIVRSIGLTKLNQIVERPDTDSIRGIVKKVPHLLRIVE